jgi:glycerol-3-phosphate acyltransferase PlsY
VNALTATALILAAYLLGSISWSYLIVRLLQGRDIRTVGSGNAGATNVLRTAGKGAGIAALVLDLGKGVAAVLGARAWDAPSGVVAGAALAVVLGHIYPIFFGFRGGKGVATAAGALATLAPASLAAGVLVFLAVVAWWRYVSLGSMIAAAVIPIFIALAQRFGWDTREGGWAIVAAAGIAVLVVVRHRANLGRLRAGTENRLGAKRRAAASSPPLEESPR